ncbi:MAG TPA: anthranilate synthase component I, partial [Candidatus Dormibacteraeota bacterium]|nr:anthranilate synthase component I [Candidatus Dormibacteraeota bacterium]
MSEPRPGLEEAERLLDSHDRVPVVLELLGDTLTPVGAMLRLGTDAPCFLLESVEGGERVGRWSMLGRDPTVELRATVPEDPLAGIESLVGSKSLAPLPGF